MSPFAAPDKEFAATPLKNPYPLLLPLFVPKNE
jgi:hypothetical protein